MNRTRAAMPASDSRRVMLVTHPSRPDAAAVAAEFAVLLANAGVVSAVPSDQVDMLRGAPVIDIGAFGGGSHGDHTALQAAGIELVVVLGGDGTILWGAEMARAAGVPLLGLNLGHVGFLAEAEQEGLTEVATAVAARAYRVEERLAIDVEVHDRSGARTFASWALNEASIEKDSGTRMIDILVSIDEHPLSRWGTDGLVLATPTGSTAYAWSAGGPVVWPDVEALLVVPNAAHALFTRPLVIAPSSTIRVELIDRRAQRAHVWCDGRRHAALAAGATVTVRRSTAPVLLARLRSPAFVARLVGKFDLPVQGWRHTERDRGQQS